MDGVIRGPFFGKKEEAAKYCGMSRSKFNELSKKYLIPRNAGPEKKQYAASDLDAFMATPDNYLLGKSQKKNKTISKAEMGLR